MWVWGGGVGGVGRGCRYLSLLVFMCVCVGGKKKRRERRGSDADARLTTVLLLLQPKWQTLACVPIPILCCSLAVLESWT